MPSCLPHRKRTNLCAYPPVVESTSPSSPQKNQQHKHLRGRRDRIRQRAAIFHHDAVDEYDDVLAYGALIIEHIGLRPRVITECRRQDLVQRRAVALQRRTMDVSLKNVSEDDAGHAAW